MVIDYTATQPPDEDCLRCKNCGEQKPIDGKRLYEDQCEHRGCPTGITGQSMMGREWKGWASKTVSERALNQTLSDDQRRSLMLGLRAAYIVAADGLTQQAIELALMIVTEPIEDHSDFVADWKHPCNCAMCRSY